MMGDNISRERDDTKRLLLLIKTIKYGILCLFVCGCVYMCAYVLVKDNGVFFLYYMRHCDKCTTTKLLFNVIYEKLFSVFNRIIRGNMCSSSFQLHFGLFE